MFCIKVISKYFQYRFSYVTVLTLPPPWLATWHRWFAVFLVDFFYFIFRYFVLLFVLDDHVLFFSYYYLLFTCTSFCEIFFMCLFVYFVHGYIFISFLKFSHFCLSNIALVFYSELFCTLSFVFCAWLVGFLNSFYLHYFFFTVFWFFRVHSWVVFSFLFSSLVSWWIHF